MMTLVDIHLGVLVVGPFLDDEPNGRRRDGEEEAAIFFWLAPREKDYGFGNVAEEAEEFSG